MMTIIQWVLQAMIVEIRNSQQKRVFSQIDLAKPLIYKICPRGQLRFPAPCLSFVAPAMRPRDSGCPRRDPYDTSSCTRCSERDGDRGGTPSLCRLRLANNPLNYTPQAEYNLSVGHGKVSWYIAQGRDPPALASLCGNSRRLQEESVLFSSRN
jgi:hypothetical protein